MEVGVDSLEVEVVISSGVLQKCGCFVCSIDCPPNSNFKAVWKDKWRKGNDTVGLAWLFSSYSVLVTMELLRQGGWDEVKIELHQTVRLGRGQVHQSINLTCVDEPRLRLNAAIRASTKE